MFKFSIPESIDMHVNVQVPTTDQNKKAEQGFTLKLAYLSHDERNKKRDEIIADQTKNEISDKLLNELIVGWNDIQDQDGKPVEFSSSKLSELAAVPWIRKALSLAIVEYVYSRNHAELLAKNL